MPEDDGLSNKELLMEVRKDVKCILGKVNKFEEWKEENVNPRLRSYGDRIRILEKWKWQLGAICGLIAITVPLILRYLL